MQCVAVRGNFARNVSTQMFSNAINVGRSVAWIVSNLKKTKFGGVRVVAVRARFAQDATSTSITACQYVSLRIGKVLRAMWSVMGVCASARNAGNLFVIDTRVRNITFALLVAQVKGTLCHGLKCCE